MLRRLSPYWRGARNEALAGAGILLIATLIDLLQPWPIKWLIDYVFGSNQPPTWLGRLFPALVTREVTSGIATVCLSILALALLHRIASMLGHFFLLRAGARLVQQLRCHACDQLHRLSLAYHDKTKVGDSLYRVAYDVHAAQTLLNGALVPIATGGLVLLGAAAIMLNMNPQLTIITIAVTPLFFFIIRLFGQRINEQSRTYHERETALVATAQESLSSIRAIQAFTLEPETREKFTEQSRQSLLASQRMTRTQLAYAACAGLTVSVGTAAVVWFASHQVLKGHMSLGDILVFLAYLGILYQPMNAFSQSAGVIQSASAQLQRVFEVIDAVPDIRDRPGALDLAGSRGSIEFRDVSFHYTPDKPVLRNFSFKVDPGRVIAIVGRTGAGKTTIASLLLRFYDPTAGTLLLDGHDFRDIRVSSLRKQMSLVLQDPILFAGAIADNISYGKPGATRQEVEEAAKRAQADEFIRALPNGYDTLLGERGVNLSGGQRQRLSIARAFLKNAPVLILDEPTSALDVQTEQALMESLRDLMNGRTTFIIAHRLSTVRYAHEIIVLDQGHIVECGTHEELVQQKRQYAEMYLANWSKSDANSSAPAHDSALLAK